MPTFCPLPGVGPMSRRGLPGPGAARGTSTGDICLSATRRTWLRGQSSLLLLNDYVWGKHLLCAKPWSGHFMTCDPILQKKKLSPGRLMLFALDWWVVFLSLSP